MFAGSKLLKKGLPALPRLHVKDVGLADVARLRREGGELDLGVVGQPEAVDVKGQFGPHQGSDDALILKRSKSF